MRAVFLYRDLGAMVMSIVLCQQKKWSSSSLFKILISKDRKQNPFHTGSITKGSHGSASSSYLHEASFNRIGGAYDRWSQFCFDPKEAEQFW